VPQVLTIGGAIAARRPAARTAVLVQSGFMTKLVEAIKNLDDGQRDEDTYTLDDFMSLMRLEDELRMEMTKVILS
jgi:hypothetical protein